MTGGTTQARIPQNRRKISRTVCGTSRYVQPSAFQMDASSWAVRSAISPPKKALTLHGSFTRALLWAPRSAQLGWMLPGRGQKTRKLNVWGRMPSEDPPQTKARRLEPWCEQEAAVQWASRSGAARP